MLAVDLISPTQIYSFAETSVVILTSLVGQIAILPEHEPMMTQLIPGPIKISLPDGKEVCYSAAAGFAEIRPDRCLIMVDEITPNVPVHD